MGPDPRTHRLVVSGSRFESDSDDAIPAFMVYQKEAFGGKRVRGNGIDRLPISLSFPPIGRVFFLSSLGFPPWPIPINPGRCPTRRRRKHPSRDGSDGGSSEGEEEEEAAVAEEEDEEEIEAVGRTAGPGEEEDEVMVNESVEGADVHGDGKRSETEDDGEGEEVLRLSDIRLLLTAHDFYSTSSTDLVQSAIFTFLLSWSHDQKNFMNCRLL
ncbi:uncharacterized protein LOC126410458 [Nymphaea colorata]|nr:uncharacterized protein LOC126410458 [Nymphaea colorata]